MELTISSIKIEISNHIRPDFYQCSEYSEKPPDTSKNVPVGESEKQVYQDLNRLIEGSHTHC